MKQFIRRLSPRTYPLSPGFTLIELLTVIGIFAIIGTLAVSIVTLTLRGTKKSELFGLLRESGNLALAQVSRDIRYAKSLDEPNSCTPTVNVKTVVITSLTNNQKVTYACTGETLAANGSPLLDETAIRMPNCSFTCSQPTVNDPPSITLQFSLLPRVANQFIETNVPISFQSTIVMRNFNNR